MSRGFESDNISPSEDAEVIVEEKARQKIVEYLKDTKLESPRFQAFCDYTDLQNASEVILKPPQPEGRRLTPDSLFNKDMIAETIRQRANGISGYKKELYEAVNVTDAYWIAIKEGRFPASPMTQKVFATELLKIKNQEIARKSQQHSPPLQIGGQPVSKRIALELSIGHTHGTGKTYYSGRQVKELLADSSLPCTIFEGEGIEDSAHPFEDTSVIKIKWDETIHGKVEVFCRRLSDFLGKVADKMHQRWVLLEGHAYSGNSMYPINIFLNLKGFGKFGNHRTSLDTARRSL